MRLKAVFLSIHLFPPAAASSSQAMPPSFDIEATFTELMSSMGALQWEVNLTGERVEQC
jgi:hypothetical protein